MRALVVALALPVLLSAQPARRFGKAEAQGEDGALARQMAAVRLKQIREVMALPEAQAQAITDRWSQHDHEFVQNTRQLNHLRAQFREVLLGPGGEEEKNARIRPLLDQFMDLRRKQMESRARFETDIRAGLSPAQQARLIMLVDEFTRRLAEGLANRPGLMRRQQGQ